MFALNLPLAETKIIVQNKKQMIFDFLRRRYVALTPEEWVRQQFTHYLIDCKGYPVSLMGNEITLKVGNRSLRCDSVVFRRDTKPLMILEYKAPTVEITQQTFEQICSYNIALHADYLTVSNGMRHYCCKIDYSAGSYSFLEDIPEYSGLQILSL